MNHGQIFVCLVSELTLEWGDDWICFLDAVTQAALCSLVPKTLQEGIRNKLAGIGSLTIDPTLQEFSGTSTCKSRSNSS